METQQHNIRGFFETKYKSKKTTTTEKPGKQIPQDEKPTLKKVDLIHDYSIPSNKENVIILDNMPIRESEYEKLLDDFDYNIVFGPIMGITRLERYERAVKFGLNPPSHIKEIITKTPTKENFFNTCSRTIIQRAKELLY